MAISSRLALWEQKIREENKSPPPSSPPPLFSVIPGGFIKQLVRETEKESKEARRTKEAALASPERETPDVSSSSMTNSDPQARSQRISPASPFPSPQSTDIPGRESPVASGKDSALVASGEKTREQSPSVTPAKKPAPFRRGVRRGDVLLMVAKLDPELAKPEQRTLTGKPLAPASDPGGTKKGDTPGTPRGPQDSNAGLSPKADRARTGGAEDPGQDTKGEKQQGTAEKGSQGPQTKGKRAGEPPEGKGEQGTRSQAQGPGDKGKVKTAEEGGSLPKKKKDVPQEAEGRLTEPPVPVRKWGGPLGRRSKWDSPQSKKDKVTEPPKRAEKAGEQQTKMKERGQGQVPESPGKKMEPAAGPEPSDIRGPQGESVSPEKPQGKPAEAGEARTSQEEKAPERVAARKEGRPESSARDSGEPRLQTGGGGGAPGLQPEGLAEPAPRTEVERPAAQRPVVGTEEEPGRGGQSGDSDQALEDRWYEAEKVWLVQKDGFTLATVLKPDEGTADLPAGRVRLCIDEDKTVTEVDEDSVHRANPPELDQAEDLASLVSVNESSVLNTLLHRFKAQLPYTHTGPDLILLQASGGKVPRGQQDGPPAHIVSLAQRAYWALLSQRRDQSIVALGRSGSGKTVCCEQVLEHLVGMAGSVDGRVSVEKIQATFTILRAFGCVSTSRSPTATRFAMVMSLDFSATGRVTAAQLQTMLLEKTRVARQPEGEGNFQVFSQLLAGLDLDLRTELNLHQMADSSSFGMGVWSKPEDKQKAAAAFAQLQGAMETLGITEGERRAIWQVLAAIYHLGAAGACKVGRKQFMRFERATHAAEALGCNYEELNTATFKHHLRQIIQQMTAGPRRSPGDEDTPSGLKMTGAECVEGMASGLYQELFAAVVSLINRSFSSHHLSMASIMVVDSAGFQNPRHQGKDRAATFEELCHNYAHERLQLLFYRHRLVSRLQRYREEGVPVNFDLPESSPGATVDVVDQNPSQVHSTAGGDTGDARGLFWVLDEEARMEGSSASTVLECLRAAFEKKGAGAEGTPVLRACEQPLQCEIAHQLGQDAVRYDLSGWLPRAKPNLSALEAPHILQQSKREELRSLFQPRANLPPVCRAVAGLEGTSQQAVHRSRVVRRTFASSLAAVKRKAPCVQIKLQMDALVNLVRRSQLHFVHCLMPISAVEIKGGQGTPSPPCPGRNQQGADETPALDIPALRVQLAGSHILEALRLHRAGYADHMGLAQFRRRFQALDPVLLKEFASTSEGVDERKAVEQLLQALDLEKKAVAVGHSHVFLKAGVVSRLERQREKLVSGNIVLFQATCRGFLSRQEFKKMKIRQLAARCIQKNMAAFLAVKDWSWWQLLTSLRPLLTAAIGTEQVRAKEEELTLLRQKLQTSEKLRSELRQSTDLLESKIADLTSELADERFKGDVACQALENERAERLQAFREVQDLKSKYEQVQRKLGDVEKQLEEAQHKVQLPDVEKKPTGGAADEWQMQLDCAQLENEFLRKRLQQFEERLESELASRKELEQKFGELQSAYEEAKKMAQQMKKKCHHLTWDLEDTRVLLENQQSHAHELEKKQKRFDMQLAQALGESLFERKLREKASQETVSVRWELSRLQQQLEQKEQETSTLKQEIERLQDHKRELLGSAGDNCVAGLKEKLWKLESSAREQEKVHSQQENTIKQLEQLRQRFELEIERMKQMRQKDREDQEEELEDVRQSCQKRLRQLEMQLEQEYEEKQMVLHEKQDLEGLIGTLCDQIGHRDFDVEKRLRRDLRRTHALLSDVQLLLTTVDEGKTSVNKEELEKVHSQLEQSKAKCEDALKTQKALTADLESMHSELENMTRSKSLVDEQLHRLQFERTDLLKRIDEDQDDLNELMQKHKDLIAQSAADIGQIQELQIQLEEAKKEKQKLQEQLQVAQLRIEYLEKSTVDRAIVSRQEAVICDLENKTEFQKVQIKRFEVLVIRLRDSLIKMGEELSQAAMSEAQQRENSQYYQRRLAEMKVEMEELVQREAEASRRCMELEKCMEELVAVRQTLQTDLETSIRRIADLQAALEEVASSDSDTESVQTAVDCGIRGRKETDNVSVVSSQPEGSVQSWLSCSLSLATDTARSPSRQSAISSSLLGPRTSQDNKDAERPASSLSRAWDVPSKASRVDSASPQSIHLQKPYHFEDGEGFALQRKPTVERSGVLLSSSPTSRSTDVSPPPREKLPSPSAALSEFVEGLRKKRGQRGQGSTLRLEDAPTLPIYQTTGAFALRRGRTSSDEGDLSLRLGTKSPLEAEGGPGTATGLLRSTSLKCITSEGAEGATPLPDKPKTRFSSCESLLESGLSSGRNQSSLATPRDPVLSPLLRPRRPCLESSVDDAVCPDLGKEPLIFQNRQFAHLTGEPLDSDPLSWKLPSLSYRRQTKVDFDDFLPAIRKPSAPGPSAGAVKDGPPEASKRSSVHFELEGAGHSFLSGVKTILKKSPGSKEDPAQLSDSSSSSSSIVSFKSADSVKSAPRRPRLEGDGGERTSPGHREPGAGQKEDDVASIMKKYLQT